ncbi:MAG: 4Fe-4S dicluster domain-containing protein [Nanoarchaeota archaeon]|nr:4Fe-4S dicluster domain-containing protein [Nanoarchaeota archaeon]
MQVSMQKGVFDDFVREVMQSREFVAPVKGDQTKEVQESFFTDIKDPSQIEIGQLTYFPIKYYFFAKKEVLFSFHKNRIEEPEIDIPERVFFGLRLCDLNSIKHQDTVFLNNGFRADPYYQARREHSLLIGMHCKKGDDHCFCQSIGLKDFYDLMFFDKDEHTYGIDVGSEKGKAFVDEFRRFFEEKEEGYITPEDKVTINTFKLDTTNIKNLWDNEVWSSLSEKCTACAACNNLCPNCHCFTVEDEVEVGDVTKGQRVRKPAACLVKGFTRVAGDHVFRDDLVGRFRHRIFHQLEFFRDRYGETMCTGCGRCIRGCPAKIDWVTGINTAARKQRGGQE